MNVWRSALELLGRLGCAPLAPESPNEHYGCGRVEQRIQREGSSCGTASEHADHERHRAHDAVQPNRDEREAQRGRDE